jgi:hypothetical protein
MKTILGTILILAISFGLIGCKPGVARALKTSSSSKDTGRAIGKTIGAGAKAYGRLNDKEDE